MKISVIINVDTRSENNKFGGMFNGCVNEDFLTDGIYNKVKFFEGFDKEVIVFIDQHQSLKTETLEYIRTLATTVVIRNHTTENAFNDMNYLRALYMASGDIICKIDQDTACFTSSTAPIQEMIDLLEQYAFVSYPSYWSPRAVHDETFGHRTWSSTRFFICKKEAIKFEELKNCILEPNWGYEKYGDSPRRCNWLEHFLTLTNNDSCYYPPIDLNKISIFCWGSYTLGTLKMLNEKPYDEVRDFILSKGGLVYPNDLHV